MSADSKFNFLKQQLTELLEHCQEAGDTTTEQLLLEVEELLHISHESFLGNALQSIRVQLKETDDL